MSFLPSIVPALRAKVMATPFIQNNPSIGSLIGSPAGPFTIHFWAPTFKWCITIANIADLSKPVELVSTPQQCAVTLTGLIWSRYSFVITPVNYTLFSVNIFMAGSGLAQLYRVWVSDFTKVGGGGGGGGTGADKEAPASAATAHHAAASPTAKPSVAPDAHHHGNDDGHTKQH